MFWFCQTTSTSSISEIFPSRVRRKFNFNRIKLFDDKNILVDHRKTEKLFSIIRNLRFPTFSRYYTIPHVLDYKFGKVFQTFRMAATCWLTDDDIIFLFPNVVGFWCKYEKKRQKEKRAVRKIRRKMLHNSSFKQEDVGSKASVKCKWVFFLFFPYLFSFICFQRPRIACKVNFFSSFYFHTL